MSSSITNTQRSTRIEEKKRKKREKSTSDNTSERSDNNGTTKPKKYKTDKNGNGQCQLDHDNKLDDMPTLHSMKQYIMHCNKYRILLFIGYAI